MRDVRHLILTHPPPLTDDTFGVGPFRFWIALDQGAAKENLDLVKRPVGIMKLVDEADRSNVHLQTTLLEHFSGKVVRKTRMRLNSAARRAEQVVPTLPGIDQKQAVVVKEDRPHRNPGRPGAGFRDRHGVKLAKDRLRRKVTVFLT